MIDPNMVPTIDPNPLPAPYWVFKLLLIVTFFLHILAMNCMLGGAALALLARWRRGKNNYGNRIFFDVAKKVPSCSPQPSASALRRCSSSRSSTDSTSTPRPSCLPGRGSW